jgi:DNA repair exonuclease SbcCD ATPase subunit
VAFADQLARLEVLDRTVTASVESLAQRQSSIDAVRAELTRLFEFAAGATKQAGDFATLRQDVQAARETFDAVLRRAEEAERVTARAEQRAKAVDEAEQRLARLDALLGEVRQRLDQVRGEKAVVDRVAEQSARLSFQLKEAEALLAALKKERELAARLRERAS